MDKSLIEMSVTNENTSDQIENQLSPDPLLVETNNTPSVLNEAHQDGSLSIDNNVENDRHIVREISTAEKQEKGRLHHTEVVPPLSLENSESSFSCKYPGCNFTTVDAELYLKHEDTHIDVGAVACEVCGMTFTTYAFMRRHQLYVHQGIRTFECQYCSKRFLRKEQFVEHLARHTKPRPYQCTFCGETFNFRGHLKTHVSTEHAGIVVGKTCHLCNFKASSPNAIKVHFATFHLKPNNDNVGVDTDRIRSFYGNSQNQINHGENSAIDLAAVSQNFSYLSSHYPSFSMTNGDGVNVVPGPSDLSCRSKVLRHINAAADNGLINTNDTNSTVALKNNTRHTCVTTSQAGSTVISPSTYPERIDPRARHRVSIKPEPPELVVDDSQSSNVQPTSTMDLSTNDVVETTCHSHDIPGSSDSLGRRKIHKHSSSDDTGSESHHSPNNRICLDGPATVRTGHTCYRYRPYDESSSQRCREYSRHTCASHHNDRRIRLSDSDAERSTQNEQSDGEERKIFYSRATSTNNSVVPDDTHYSRTNLGTTYNNESFIYTSVPNNITNNYVRKNIAIRDIESCTLTCTFCGIIFPDQTLYLLHRSLHSESSPWKCNLCGKNCSDKYDFNSHVISKGHY